MSINSDFGSPPPVDYSSDSSDVGAGESVDSGASVPSSPDSISSSSSSNVSLNAIDLSGGLSYIDYLAQVSKPQLANKKTLQESAQNDFGSNTIKQFLLSILLDVQNIRKYRQQVIENGAGLEELRNTQNEQIDAFNDQRKIYNKGDGITDNGVADENQAIDDLNTAISQFNSGAITEPEFRAAVDAYNSYVAARNAGGIASMNTSIETYNQQVAANNAEIDAMNVQRALLGLSPIPYQATVPNVTEMTAITVPIEPFSPPLSLLTEVRQTIPKVQRYTAPPTEDDLNDLVDSMLKSTTDVARKLGDKVEQIQDVAQYIRFKLYPKRANAPDAYIEHFNNRSPTARGGSTFGLSFFVAGSDPNLLATLSLSNFKNQLSEFGDPIQSTSNVGGLPQESDAVSTTDNLIDKTLDGAAAASVQGFEAVQNELGLTVAPGSLAGNLVLALVFSQEISKLIADPDLTSSIAASLSGDPALANLSVEQRLQLVSLSTEGIKQNLSLTALLQIAITANLPGLVGQVLGQAVADLANGIGPEPTIAQFNELLGSGPIQENLLALLQSKPSGVSKSAVTAALEKTLLQGAVFATPSGEAVPGTPLVGGDGAPLLGADGKPLTIPENGIGEAVEGGVGSGESLRASLLGVSDALGGFTPTVLEKASKSPQSAIAGFNFTSEGRFQSQLALNLENQGVNSIIARNLSVDATLSLVNITGIPGIIGSDLYLDVGLAGGAEIGKQEVQQEILKGSDASTQLSNAISAALQKDEIDTVGQLRDEITRQLVSQNVDFDQALALANATAQRVIAFNKPFSTTSIDVVSIKATLSTELIKRGILDSFAASNAADKLVEQAFNQSSAIVSESVFRSALASEIVQQGIASRDTAAAVADAIAVTRNSTPSEALRTTDRSKQLTPNELASELQTSLLAILTGQIGLEQSKKLSGAIVNAVVGFEATQGEPTRNPLSISNQIRASVDLVIQVDQEKYSENLTQNFREFSSPNLDLFTQTQRRLDPANSILMSSATGVMYDQSPGGSTFQTPGSSRDPNINSLAV